MINLVIIKCTVFTSKEREKSVDVNTISSVLMVELNKRCNSVSTKGTLHLSVYSTNYKPWASDYITSRII